ncbi:MAG TPA: hypothetical protein DDZ91_11730 [Firmicutes bacterium]|jgi:transcriptional regulator with XRE-family HTH domain|nr:hypothetical protein [Bacillota bacterium]
MVNINVGNVKVIFGKRLQQALTERNMQQNDLAKELDISSKTMSTYIHGKASPTITGLAKIARFLGISADYFLGLSNELRPLDNIDYDPIGEEMLMIRRSYTSMPEHQRKAFIQLAQAIAEDK